MQFVAICQDKPGHLEVRLSVRPQHRTYLEGAGSLLQGAGPILADDGETMVGSILLIEAPDLATAKAFLAEDPYAKAGLFQSVEVKPWKWLVKPPAA